MSLVVAAQIVEYQLTRADRTLGLVECSFTLWIDLKTRLPLKRRQVFKEHNQRVTVTEVYSAWSLNEDSDATLFRVQE